MSAPCRVRCTASTSESELGRALESVPAVVQVCGSKFVAWVGGCGSAVGRLRNEFVAWVGCWRHATDPLIIMLTIVMLPVAVVMLNCRAGECRGRRAAQFLEAL